MVVIPPASSSSQELVAQRMQHLIAAWEQAHDHRAIFLNCYYMMTQNMSTALDKGEFEDPQWVTRLLQRFADYYFVALDAYESQGEVTPAPWKFAFDAALPSQPRCHVVQHLILGVNAHINYDLVFALADLLAPEWAGLSAEQRQSRYRDHNHVNEIIIRTMDDVQDQVVERYSTLMQWVDTLFGSLDEWMVARLIARWREHVWDDATRMIEYADDFSAERQVLLRRVEKNAIERAQAILGKQGFAGLLELA